MELEEIINRLNSANKLCPENLGTNTNENKSWLSVKEYLFSKIESPTTNEETRELCIKTINQIDLMCQ